MIEIERDWITKAGLRAVVAMEKSDKIGESRCGYVGVPKDSPLHGQEYQARVPKLYESPQRLIQVHNGLSYSNNCPTYPVQSDLWWFGFDCTRDATDGPGGKPLEFCVNQCESMATQIQKYNSIIM